LLSDKISIMHTEIILKKHGISIFFMNLNFFQKKNIYFAKIA